MAVQILMPRLSDSMEEGTITRWLVASGDTVTAGTPLVEVETDKATVTYESECDGTILELAAAEGDSVAVGAVIAAVGEPGERPQQRVKASPLARRLAAEMGIELASLAGSGPHGRVVRADVLASAGTRRGSDPAAGSPRDDGAPREKGSASVQALTLTQQTIARRMSASRATVPDFELRSEFEVSALVAARSQLAAATGQPPSYNDFIVKAAALALREFPRINGSYRDGALETYDRVNVGIAVAADDALVVPTIFDADRKSVGAIATEAATLAAKVRDGSITPAELSGATFSVSNLGMYGVDSFSAVIDAPQAAILAVGALKPRPVVAEDAVTLVARPTVQVSLACDHRIIYGADAARFLKRLGELLATPVALLL